MMYGMMGQMVPQLVQRLKASGPGCKRRRNCQAVIVNADDFGRSPGINAAIMRAHREGVLTSASLMVAGEAVDEAVALARETPSLAVGLHLVAVGGPAVLPAREIPHLVGDRGCFPNDPFRTGVRYFFSKAARRELGRELAAQFERFAWNEHIPSVPKAGPDLAWGPTFRLNLSFRTSGPFERSFPSGGRTDLAQMTDMLRHWGFDLVQHNTSPAIWRCIADFFANLYALGLIWAYNPTRLGGQNLVSLRRDQIWMSREMLIRKYGVSGCGNENVR